MMLYRALLLLALAAAHAWNECAFPDVGYYAVPGLAVRPVCFRRVFGGLAVKDLALGVPWRRRLCSVQQTIFCNRLSA